jgi:ribosome-associated toxin RatA of RatAB toxin-antitoxin module
MHLYHRVHVDAPYETVFALARDVEGWTRLLRDYRWCRVIERTGSKMVFAMGGWIRGWPGRWTAVQDAMPDQRRLRFRHIRGITKGMDVEWRFEPAGSSVHVELVHDLTMGWPLIGRWVGDWIVGPIFVDHITQRTLRAVKAEAERLAAGGRGS